MRSGRRWVGTAFVVAACFAAGFAAATSAGWWIPGAGLAVLIGAAVLAPWAVNHSIGLHLDRAAQPCARCGTAPRAARGWCPTCEQELRAAEPAGEPTATFVRAIVDDDWEAMRQVMARQVTSYTPTGSSTRSSRPAFIWGARSVGWFTEPLRNEIGATYADPADPSVSWLLSDATVRWRVTRRVVEVSGVQRYVTDSEGKIAEVHGYAPLAEPPSVRKRI